MKRFIIQLIKFAMPLIVVGGLLEWSLHKIPGLYSIKADFMNSTNSPDTNTLILGSSRLMYGIDPDSLNGVAFNLANVSQIPYFDKQLFDQFPKDNLHIVIMEISYFTLFCSINHFMKIPDGFRTTYYNIYHGINPDPLNPANYLEIIRRTPSMQKIRKFISGKDSICNLNGFATDFLISDKSKNWTSGDSRALAEDTTLDSIALADNIAFISSINTKCLEIGAHLILVIAPAWHTYNDNRDPAQIAMMHNAIKQFENLHIPVLDYTYDKRFDNPDLWHDSGHLATDTGAPLFSSIIKKDIDSIVHK